MIFRKCSAGYEITLFRAPYGVAEMGVLKPKDVIVSGVPVCSGGKLCEGVEDITEYRTEIDEDGNKIQVEVLPEDAPELPTYDGNTIPQIKEFMIENDISYSYLDSKLDLIEKIIIFYDNL